VGGGVSFYFGSIRTKWAAHNRAFASRTSSLSAIVQNGVKRRTDRARGVDAAQPVIRSADRGWTIAPSFQAWCALTQVVLSLPLLDARSHKVISSTLPHDVMRPPMACATDDTLCFPTPICVFVAFSTHSLITILPSCSVTFFVCPL